MSQGLCASLATLCTASLHVMGTDRRGGKLGVSPLTLAPAWCSVPLSQAEVCSGTVADVLQSVVSGADGCIFSFGHTSLGKHPPSALLLQPGPHFAGGKGDMGYPIRAMGGPRAGEGGMWRGSACSPGRQGHWTGGGPLVAVVGPEGPGQDLGGQDPGGHLARLGSEGVSG